MNPKIIFLSVLSMLLTFSYDVFAKAKKFTLSNGMQVVVVENNRAPVIAQMIWYNFGSNVEQKGKSGLAHFMEHLMFKGTKKHPDSYYSNFISKIGGSENAFTSYDYTAYYQIYPSEHFEKIIELEADRMKNLTLTKKNVEIEKNVILEERFQRIESDPSSLLDESMRSILYPNHPYGRPIIGWKHEIMELNYDDVKKFYKTHYEPRNAILVISGDINLKKAKEIVKKNFSKIKNSNTSKFKETLDPNLNSQVFVEKKHSTVKQDIWKKLYRADSYNKSIKRGIALDLGMKIIAGGTSSLLYDEFVNKKKIFSMIGGFYQGLSRGEGYIYFYAIPNEKIEPKKIDNLIMEKIKILVKNELSLKRLETEKKKYFYDSIYRMDGILKPSEIYGEALTVGLTLSEVENWNKNLDDITIELVKEEMLKFIENKNYVIGSLQN